MGNPLIDSALGNLPAGFEALKARDVWRAVGGWDFDRLRQYMPAHKLQELSSVVLDTVTGARDRLSWGPSGNGKFTVKSAYDLLTHEDTPGLNMESFYAKIWKVVAPERVRTFLWLVSKQVIMTNVERFRRHLGDTTVCQICKGDFETILHVIRDCPAIQGVWTRIVPRNQQTVFFAQSLFEWMYGNLNSSVTITEGSWSTLFAMTVWWGWKWRCGNVFGENRPCKDRVVFVKKIAKEITKAHAKMESGTIRGGDRIERMIGWVAPTPEWLKLNTDGASHGNPGPATAGGVLRNFEGEWCGGFALNIGRCSAMLAELWGVYYGLCIAWDKGVARLVLEVDSELVVGFLSKGIDGAHPLSFLVRLCQGFLTRDWIVRIVHVYREANHLADGLANYAFSLPVGFHTFDAVPDFCSVLLRDDAEGVLYPRLVHSLL